MRAGYIEPKIYHAEKNQLALETDRLEHEKQLLSKSINGDLKHLKEAKKLQRFSAKHVSIETFDDDMFLEYVDTSMVNSREEIVFNIYDGSVGNGCI